MIIKDGEVKLGKRDICYYCDVRNRCHKLARLRGVCNGDIIEWKICPVNFKQDGRLVNQSKMFGG